MVAGGKKTLTPFVVVTPTDAPPTPSLGKRHGCRWSENLKAILSNDFIYLFIYFYFIFFILLCASNANKLF